MAGVGYSDQIVRGARPLNVFTGGSDYLRLKTADGTTAKSPPNNQRAWALAKLVNTGAAQTVAVSVYDVAPGDSTSGLTPIFGPVTLGANAVIDLQLPLQRGGFALVAAAGGVTADVVLSYWA